MLYAMAEVVRAEQLTKSYGHHRGIVDVDFSVEAGEVFGYPGPERRRQVDDDPPPARPDPPDPRAAHALRSRLAARRASRLRRRIGYLPGDLRLYERLTGRELFDVLRPPARARRHRARAGARRAPRPRPRPADRRALAWQPPEGRPRPGVHARARPARPGRADERPRPARPADVLRARRRGDRARRHRLPLVARPARGPAHGRPRRADPRRPARPRRQRREASRARVHARRGDVRRASSA